VNWNIARFLLVTVSPVSELRGGIPIGIEFTELPHWSVLLIAVVANALMFFPIFFGLRLFYDRLLSRIPFFDRYLDSVRRRGKPLVDKYGFWGLTFLVALPLPITGVYTGTSLAWLLDMDWRKACPAAVLGVTIAGVIVFLITRIALGLIRAP